MNYGIDLLSFLLNYSLNLICMSKNDVTWDVVFVKEIIVGNRAGVRLKL